MWVSSIDVRAPGCYAYQVDGVGFSDVVVFEAVQEPPGDLTPLPPSGSLPRELDVDNAVQIDPDTVRLALYGDHFLTMQLDVGPTQDAQVKLPGADVQRLYTGGGLVLWRPDPDEGWLAVAVWDDGAHRYRLTVRSGQPGAFSVGDLSALVEAFDSASESNGS